jgi:hypothetical protein
MASVTKGGRVARGTGWGKGKICGQQSVVSQFEEA